MTLALSSRRAALSPGQWVRNELWRRARAVPSLDLRFAESKSLRDSASGSELVTFTRASSGTFVGSDGVIKTATTNDPRFDHNPTTGESLGLLVEEARSNLLTYSEQFDNAAWLKGASSITATDSAVAPSGATAADTWTVDSSSAQHYIQVNGGEPITSGVTYSRSCFVKKINRRYIQSAFSSAYFGVNAWATFDLDTGTVTNSGNAGTYSIVSYPNGWYRLTVTAPATASGPSAGNWLGFVNDAGLNTRLPTFTGNGSDAFYLWGAQLEAGAFPTSYIPTTTATVTRSADVASISGTNFSSWYNSSATTIYAHYSTAGALSGLFPSVASLSSGANSNRIQISHNSGSRRAVISSGGGSQWDTTGGDLGSVTANVAGKFALAAQNADFAAVANGAIPVAQMSGSLPTGITQLVIGGDGASLSSSQLNGTIRRLVYWGQRLPNNVLQAITQ